MSYLGVEGLHAFVTGAAGGIGSAIVAELLANGCKVTAHDLESNKTPPSENLFLVQGDISDEHSISACIAQARKHYGPIHILVANAGVADESEHPSIWEISLERWENRYKVNIRGTFLTVKHFLLSAKSCQEESGKEIDNLAIVLIGSETGVFGQAGHSEYASGKSALQYGLVRTVKNEIVKLNSKARINAVAPGWVNTSLNGNRLDDQREYYIEAQGTVALKKIAEPVDVAKAVAFLSSHRAAGHVTGQCLQVDGGMEGRIIWREEEILGKKHEYPVVNNSIMPQHITPKMPKNTIKIAWSCDFDAVSGWLGTGANAKNSMADFSSGYFAAQVGVGRLLKLFEKLGISDKVTWCVPGHSMETFPEQTRAIVDSGAELALHGYSHEASSQMTAEQERDVLHKTVALATRLTGKKPRGYRAPLYQLNERTIALLQEHDFLWDSSLSHHDSTPYYLPENPAPIEPIDFSASAKASDWMHPSPNLNQMPKSSLVELPLNWYMEDMTPLQFFPNVDNSAGYVDVRVVERMWMDRFEWLLSEIADGREDMTIFSIVLHPDTSGMAHVIGMVERFLKWVMAFGDEVEFWTCGRIAEEWSNSQKK